MGIFVPEEEERWTPAHLQVGPTRTSLPVSASGRAIRCEILKRRMVLLISAYDARRFGLLSTTVNPPPPTPIWSYAFATRCPGESGVLGRCVHVTHRTVTSNCFCTLSCARGRTPAVRELGHDPTVVVWRYNGDLTLQLAVSPYNGGVPSRLAVPPYNGGVAFTMAVSPYNGGVALQW
eukprot:835230-Rhodomonas_salina.2